MAISPFRFYSIYQGVHLHFTSSYDLFKYKGKSKASLESFERRKDHARFIYWSNHFDNQEKALRFCVFNSIHKDAWFYDAYETARDISLAKDKFYSRFIDHINTDYNTIKQLKQHRNVKFNQLIQPTSSGDAAPILQLYFKAGISLEFLCLLNHYYHVVDLWKETIDPLAQKEVDKICKYTPFVLLFSKVNERQKETPETH